MESLASASTVTEAPIPIDHGQRAHCGDEGSVTRLGYWWRFDPWRGAVLRWLASTALIYAVHFGVFPPSARISLPTALILTAVLSPAAIWMQARRIRAELMEEAPRPHREADPHLGEDGREWRR